MRLVRVDIGENPHLDQVGQLRPQERNTTPSNTDDEPTWAQAIMSQEQEYWIAGTHDKLKSLQDLKVFILVLRSQLPHGQWPLKGQLMCKCKCDSTGNVIRYKVQYVVKGFSPSATGSTMTRPQCQW